MQRLLISFTAILALLASSTALQAQAQDKRWESVSIIKLIDDSPNALLTALVILNEPAIAATARAVVVEDVGTDFDGHIVAERIEYKDGRTSYQTNLIRIVVSTENPVFRSAINTVVLQHIAIVTDILNKQHASDIARQQAELEARLAVCRKHLEQLTPDEEGNLLTQAVAAQIEDPLPEFRTQLRKDIYRTELELEALKQRAEVTAVHVLIPPSPPINQ
ncbi:hypothetical protein [Mucisphaera calidilacus]|uniref:Uncharacterized protein n=1 Tax=Mucisphaera calidilacus TaxID=2527982 RepID=A0A518BV79_9BACT|nr:hypothetical protein [Mucisphaera calidilacus]QDU70893.1 hypothetical protein Pan265_07340 [Mucisphaera calidilacus]